MPRLAARPFAAAFVLSAGLFAHAAPALAAASQDTPSANLGPTFVKDATARYEITTTARQVIAAQGQQLVADISSTLQLTVKVEEVTPEGARILATIDTIDSFIQSPALFTEFSSNDPVENDGASMLAPLLRPILGKSFTVSLTPTGSTANVDGIDQLLPADPNMQQLVAQAIGAQGLGTAVVGLFVLKDGMEPIAKGDSWEDVQQAAAPPLGVITITTNAKLTDVTSELASVYITGVATFTADAAATAQGMTIAIEESKIEGEVIWDVKTDMLRSSVSKSVMMLTMRSVMAPDSKQSVRVENESSAKRLD
ncbi:MAG: hypothetical protein KF684_03155 [Phycisphaeraceae bacterium]|nr:hypothetical protein [Phycisphaeraceae bacterium]